MKINKIIAKGLILTILFGSTPTSSFASEINLKENKLEVRNIGLPEISPQMLSVIASIAVGAGITLTTDDDIYDIARLVYDYYQGDKEDIENIFNNNVSIDKDGIVKVGEEFLDICKSAFDKYKSYESQFGTNIIGMYCGYPIYDDCNNGYNKYLEYKYLDGIDVSYAQMVSGDVRFSIGEFNFWVKNRNTIVVNDTLSYSISNWGYENDGKFCLREFDNKVHLTWQEDWKSSARILGGTVFNLSTYADTTSDTLLNFENYNSNNIYNNIKDNFVNIYVPSNVRSLVGQAGGSTIKDGLNNPTYDLINPCKQKIIIPEISNPSINIAGSVEIKTGVNCLVYNAEELVQKAEQSKETDDIGNARDLVNKLPESSEKEELQNRLDAIIVNFGLYIKNSTSSVDIYMKSENTLSMILDTNSVSFEDFIGVDDLEKQGAINITINSSLPYQFNAYLSTEIQNSDGSKIMDKSVFNIREGTEEDYNTFSGINEKLVLKDNCSAGNGLTHRIDLKLKGDISHEKDIYRTTIKFEAQQK